MQHIFALAVLTATATLASAQPDLFSWIPVQCCVTNNCCFQIEPTDVRSLSDDNWQILASGQVLKRTAWSPDGKYWRCACDQIDGKWVVFPTAFTRCIFPPVPVS